MNSPGLTKRLSLLTRRASEEKARALVARFDVALLAIVESVRKDDGSPQRKQGKEFRRCRSLALLAQRAPNTFGIPQAQLQNLRVGLTKGESHEAVI